MASRGCLQHKCLFLPWQLPRTQTSTDAKHTMRCDSALIGAVARLRFISAHIMLDARAVILISSPFLFCRMFGSMKRCARCQAAILSSELVMRARELVFHVRCFSCAACAVPLTKGDQFGMRDGAVLCRLHYEMGSELHPAQSPPVPVYPGPHYPGQSFPSPEFLHHRHHHHHHHHPRRDRRLRHCPVYLCRIRERILLSHGRINTMTSFMRKLSRVSNNRCSHFSLARIKTD